MRLFQVAMVGTLLAGCAADELPGDGEHDDFVSDGKADGWIAEGSADAQGVLRLVNSLDGEALHDAVGVTTRGARNIASHRAGRDRQLGTADDNPFDDLRELDKVSYVGPITFRLLADYAWANGYVPTLDSLAAATQDFISGNGVVELEETSAALPTAAKAQLAAWAEQHGTAYRLEILDRVTYVIEGIFRDEPQLRLAVFTAEGELLTSGQGADPDGDSIVWATPWLARVEAELEGNGTNDLTELRAASLPYHAREKLEAFAGQGQAWAHSLSVDGKKAIVLDVVRDDDTFGAYHLAIFDAAGHLLAEGSAEDADGDGLTWGE